MQEGAEEDLDPNKAEDITGEPIDTEEKEEDQPVERPRKTSKYMTKYERARILGTRALQIRFSSELCETKILLIGLFVMPCLKVRNRERKCK